jgi:excisionase family DNA binding protein
MRYLKVDDLRTMATISVEEASFLIGLSRTATYEACDKGHIECIRIGKRIRVLARPLFRMLTGSAAAVDVAVGSVPPIPEVMEGADQ